MSRDNKCFLFEDRLEQMFKVYKLDYKIDYNKGKKKFFFKPLYTIDIMKLKIMAKFFTSHSSTYRKIVKHILQCGHLRISNSGNIALTFNSYNPRTRNCKFEVFGSFIKRDESVINSNMNQFEESCIQEEIIFDQKGVNIIN